MGGLITFVEPVAPIAVKPILLLFYTALFLSLLVVPLSGKIAMKLGAIDSPDARKVHMNSTPRLGGMGIACGLLVGLLMFFYPFDSLMSAFFLGAVVVFLTGLIDDLFVLKPLVKFLGQVLAVTIFVVMGDQHLNGVGNLLGTGAIEFGWLSGPLTVIFMVGLINAFNLSDGLDGLAGGLAVIGSLFLGALAYKYGAMQCLAIIAACQGAILGFLRFNAYPAKLFMGDCGSLLIGYVLSTVAVVLVNNKPDIVALPMIVATILALPIVDTLFVMGRRVWHGYSPFLPDKTHLHHRLMALGLPHAAVVPVLYSIMALFGFLAIGQRHLPEYVQLLSALGLALALYGSVSLLQHYGYCFQSRGAEQSNPVSRAGISIRFSDWAGRSIPMVMYSMGLALCIPFFLIGAEGGESALLFAMAVGLVVVLLFPWRSLGGHMMIIYALVYILGFSVLFLLNIHQASSPWIRYYLLAFSIVLMIWAWFKIYFKKHGEIFLTSGLEVLMISISWFFPLVLIPLIGVSQPYEIALWYSCIEAIPLMLAIKIIIRSKPQSSYVLLCALFLPLLIYMCSGTIL